MIYPKFFEAMPHLMWRRSLKNQEEFDGQAQPARTSGGRAAKKMNFQRCVETNAIY
jgi:hypothetical protein